MSHYKIDFRGNAGSDPDSIRDLLAKLDIFNKLTDEDEISVNLPRGGTYSDIALTLLYMKMEEYRDFPCRNRQLFSSDKDGEFFDERHFFDRLVNDYKPKKIFSQSSNIMLHYNTFSLSDDENDVASKLSNSMHNKLSSLPLASEIKIHIQELVSNAFHHSESIYGTGVLSIFNPQSGEMTFSIADRGNGVKASFLRNNQIRDRYFILSVPEILKIATDESVTCNPNNAPQYSHGNSGIGLYYLREFCKSHSGTLVIISDNGYYSCNGRKERMRKFKHKWKGTAVFFAVNAARKIDEEYYAPLRHDVTNKFDTRSFEFKNTR